jgi:hypothetical protein
MPFQAERPHLKPAENEAIHRMMDAVNLHVQARIAAGKAEHGPLFVAINLQDGSSTGDVYDNRADAERHIANKVTPYFLVAVGMQPMPFREAALVLMMHRRAYATGHRFIGTEIRTPQLAELSAGLLPRTFGAIQ